MLKNENSYYIWNKDTVETINPYFNTKEFTCKCNFPSCQEQRISNDLLNRLTKIREEIKIPITITSGYRCSEYQAHLRAQGVNTVVAKKSTHELGHAADIKTKLSIPDLLSICEKYFESIGLANTFLHLDTRPGKRRWNY